MIAYVQEKCTRHAHNAHRCAHAYKTRLTSKSGSGDAEEPGVENQVQLPDRILDLSRYSTSMDRRSEMPQRLIHVLVCSLIVSSQVANANVNCVKQDGET